MGFYTMQVFVDRTGVRAGEPARFRLLFHGGCCAKAFSSRYLENFFSGYDNLISMSFKKISLVIFTLLPAFCITFTFLYNKWQKNCKIKSGRSYLLVCR
jgi:hypothetical protein